MKTIHQALVLGMLAMPAIASAQGHAHQHGTLTLDLAVAGRTVTMQIASPLDNLVGFERAPRTDGERQRVDAALARLRAAHELFAIDPAAPGVALDELWNVIRVGERTLLGMSAMVAAVSLAGPVAVVLAALNERRRELAVLHAVGAAPRRVGRRNRLRRPHPAAPFAPSRGTTCCPATGML